MSHAIPGSEKKTYRSPQRKLVQFFEKSRNQWKAKCLEAKSNLRRIKNRAHWLAQSRDGWKARARELAQRVQELEAQTVDHQHEIKALKKSLSLSPQPRRR